MKAMRWEVQIGEQVHTVTVRFELTGGPGEVWYDDKLVESWEIRMASTRRYHVGAAAVVLSWTGGIREAECNLSLRGVSLRGREIMDQDEAGDGEGSKEWLVSALGQDHDVLLRQAEAAEARDGSWVLLVNSEPVLSLKAFINSDHHPFTIGETDALLCRQDDSCKLYIGGEFVPGQAVAEPGGDTREIPSSDQDRPPRYVIREHGERGSRERQETMVRQGMSRVRIMLALVSAAVAASVMTAIGLTNEFTVPHAILIWFFWGFAAVMGILGVYTMTTVEASLGVFFRLFGSPKVSGIWTVFLGMFYLGLSILFFWVPFFAE